MSLWGDLKTVPGRGRQDATEATIRRRLEIYEADTTPLIDFYERRMGRFKSPGQAQRFLSAFEPIRGYFNPHQHKQSATEYRETMRQRLSDWRQFTRLSSIA